MNEPIQHAQKTTGKLTAAALLAVVRQGNDGCYMHGRAAYDRASYSDAFVFTLTAKTRRDGVETNVHVDVPGFVCNGQATERKLHTRTGGGVPWMQYADVYRPIAGFWSLGLGRSESLVAALELLPRGAEVALQVGLDAGTHEYLVRAECPPGDGAVDFKGLHADHLYLHAWWMARGKRKEVRLLLDTSVIPHNTARFGSPR